MYIYICIDILECSPPVTVTSKVNRYPLLQMKPLWWLLLLCEEHICIYIYMFTYLYIDVNMHVIHSGNVLIKTVKN